jgi:hypothetical protein
VTPSTPCYSGSQRRGRQRPGAPLTPRAESGTPRCEQYGGSNNLGSASPGHLRSAPGPHVRGDQEALWAQGGAAAMFHFIIFCDDFFLVTCYFHSTCSHSHFHFPAHSLIFLFLIFFFLATHHGRAFTAPLQSEVTRTGNIRRLIHSWYIISSLFNRCY